jgi:hypothetical protein
LSILKKDRDLRGLIYDFTGHLEIILIIIILVLLNPEDKCIASLKSIFDRAEKEENYEDNPGRYQRCKEKTAC